MKAAVLLLMIASSQSCTDEATSRLIRQMALESVDTAFKRHVQTLFDVWQRETMPGQRQRIEAGMDKVIKAYLQSREAIEAWRPNKCQ